MIKRLTACVLILAACTALSGCAGLKNPYASMKGSYYLNSEKYQEGYESFRSELDQSPEDAQLNFYTGRFLLAMDKPKEALPYLEKARKLDPASADYAFWNGIAYWAVLEFDKEREAYLQALDNNPWHKNSMLYLGHNYLDRGEWDKALKRYDDVLVLDHYEPEALYGRAMALEGKKQTADALAAWKLYIKYYPDGPKAREASDRLNALGDYTYRNFLLGIRKITLHSIEFEPKTTELTEDSKASLDVVGAVMKHNQNLRLHVVAYTDGDARLAKRRAQAIKDYITRMYPAVDGKRLLLSWFGTGEKLRTRKSVTLNESVNFITATGKM